MIAIVDYGMGNLHSVAKALDAMSVPAVITAEPAVIARADGVILPGVGAFGEAVANLARRDLIPVLRDYITSGRPFLGICLGLQLLFEESEETPGVKGLSVFRGNVVRFRTELTVPHMGWNRIRKTADTPFLKGIDDGEYFYFVHSYHVVPSDPALTATVTEYGAPFASAIATGRLFACQYHPEKSQDKGLAIIRNFGALAC